MKSMPASKHRRKGKTRPRDNLKILRGQLEPFREDPEAFREDELICERLRELHGERTWSDAEFDEAAKQLVAEGKIRPSGRLE